MPDVSRERFCGRHRRTHMPQQRGVPWRRRFSTFAQAVARLRGFHVHPHDHRRNGERPGVRAVSFPELPEQPGEPPRDSRAGGNGPRMLQQHALPRSDVPPPWLGPSHAAWAGRQTGAFHIRRVRLLSALPRDRDGLLGRQRWILLLHLPRGARAAPSRHHLEEFHFSNSPDHGPGQRGGLRLLPPEQRGYAQLLRHYPEIGRAHV